MPPELGCRHALLLQGPPGPFFRRLAGELRDSGVAASKINFNGGDECFFPDGVPFRGPMATWPDFFERVVRERGVDAVVVFGDCRPIHRAAIERARALGVLVWVFEEGYVRPDYITLERDGVNGHSRLPRDPEFYRRQAAQLPAPVPAQPVGQSFARHAYYSTRYALETTLRQRRFPHYVHHRPLTPWMHAAGWIRGGARKPLWARRERELMPTLTGSLSKRFFLVPLQVHADYQIIAHSAFTGVEQMIGEVMGSFAEHAPQDAALVFKHHPMDRGYCDYTALIGERAGGLGIGERVLAIHDLHLPSLLRHARGVVTVNSTVGLSAVHHQAPVKVLGVAMYDIPGLTAQASLADFWQRPEPPDADLYQDFVTYLRATCQHNGNFYRPLHGYGTGINWLEGASPAAPAAAADVEMSLS